MHVLRDIKHLTMPFKILVLWGLCGAGTWSLLHEWPEDAARRALVSNGSRARGVVTDFRTRRVERASEELLMSYSFATESGTHCPLFDRPVGDYAGVQVGGPIDVWYDPKDPWTCVTEPELRLRRFGMAGPLGTLAFFGLIAIGGTWLMIRQLKASAVEHPPGGAGHDPGPTPPR